MSNSVQVAGGEECGAGTSPLQLLAASSSPRPPHPDPSPPTSHNSAPFPTVYTTRYHCSLCLEKRIWVPPHPPHFLERCISRTEPCVSCCSGAGAGFTRAFCCSSASSATHHEVTGCNCQKSGQEESVFRANNEAAFQAHEPMLGFHNRNLDLEGELCPESQNPFPGEFLLL